MQINQKEAVRFSTLLWKMSQSHIEDLHVADESVISLKTALSRCEELGHR